MAKYVSRVAQEDDGWTAGIIRRVSARETVVTKSQGGFATQATAQAWADQELAGFAKNLSNRRVERAAQHQKNLADKAAREAELAERDGSDDGQE